MPLRPPLCRLALALVLSLSATACLTPPPARVESPDEELHGLLVRLSDLRGGDFEAEAAPVNAPEAAAVRTEIQRLALRFPRHVPVLAANASLAFEQGDPVRAQKILDQLLDLEPGHVSALLLRVRIASEAGNFPYARRKLEEELELAPDDARLREALAGVLFLQGHWEAALEELDFASQLWVGEENTPQWRLHFHRGLVLESLGRLTEAQEAYDLSHAARPDFEPSYRRARWIGLGGAGQSTR